MKYLRTKSNFFKNVENSKLKTLSKYAILLIAILCNNHLYSQCICNITYNNTDQGNIPDLTQASHFTNAENVTISPGENIAFESGGFSLMCPGFVAEYGSVFSSKIAPCSAGKDCFHTCTSGNSNQITSIDRGPFLQKLLTVGDEAEVIIKWRDTLNRAYTVELISETGVSNFYEEPYGVTIDGSYRILFLTGLDPNTRYRYNVNYGGSNKKPITGYFTTAPIVGSDIPGNDPVSFWAMGDAGAISHYNISDMRDAYFDHTGDGLANSDFSNDCNNHFLNTDFIINLGDNAYQEGTDTQLQSAVFDPYKKILKYLPLWAAGGNHESDYPFLDEDDTYITGDDIHKRVFELPEVGSIVVEDNNGNDTIIDVNELYYSFDYGNIHFVCLYSQFQSANDSIYYEGGKEKRDKRYDGYYDDIYNKMFEWLETDLIQAQDHSKWTVLFFHKPIATAGGKTRRSTMFDIERDSELMRNGIDSMTNKFDIDLVLYGHNHHYERSYLVRSGNGDWDWNGNINEESTNLIYNQVNDNYGDYEILDYGCDDDSNCDEYQYISNYDDVLNKEAGADNGTVFVLCGASSKDQGYLCKNGPSNNDNYKSPYNFFNHPIMRVFDQEDSLKGINECNDDGIEGLQVTNGGRGLDGENFIGSLHFEVTNDQLTGTYISKKDEDGNFDVLDQFTIDKNFSNSRLEQAEKNVDNRPTLSVLPNPFSQQSTVEFELFNDSEVSIFVSDITGKKLATLANGVQKSSGVQQVTFDAKGIAPGIYYCTLINGSHIETQKIVITK